jgi:carbonic anhydrase
MFTPQLLLCRWLANCALLLVASTLCAYSIASDNVAPAPTELKPAAVDSKSAAKAATPGTPKPASEQDAIDRLREKLAAKLAAAKAARATKVGATSEPHASDKASPSAAIEAAPAAAVAKQHAAPPAVRHTPQRAKAVIHSSKDASHAAHWAYEGGSGPADWGQMKPEFTKCSTGTRQSPIDIRDGIRVSLDAVQFDYKPSAFRVIDNGHTVQVNVGQGNSIEVLGRRFELVQFHFHRPSEERINGKQFDMVAHLVHKDPEGRLAVVAVLLERGSAHAIVQSVWNNLPLEKGEEVPARTTLDLNALLPAERSYFTYMGSLTTPPCSEGVLWMVMKNAVPISNEQIGIFARLYPMNARPIQSASGRLIKESN